MRRLLSILLLAAFGLPLLTPLLAMSTASEAWLPTCCRRSGKHHCMMNTVERGQFASHDPQFRAPVDKCPFYPASVVPSHHPNPFTASTGSSIFAAVVSHPAGTAQTESKWRISRDRSRQKRGPPVLFL
jgi:hypothetical protein